ncbi:lysoplasmalogenase [Vibrio sp. SNU_ST1]|uniref:lysoplasmalogenase n=1 Tax=Vibrio sp. SNU_ST1 TaxID=3064001 RepID=UPI00272AD9C6|nr:lysoplasmalogenase [Vibrio sp. SNU_ST1]WKY57998.1 lysoplasmalogenase [Vibrio sp. SNU_ST1]
MWSWLAVSLSGIGAITGTKHGHIGQALLYKVFTFVLLATIALTQSVVVDFTYWVVAGLAISAIADVLHTVTQKRLLHFVCFLLAQLCYSKAFWLQLSGEMVWWLFALLLAACIVAFFLLLPRLDKLVFPVVIMGIVLIQLAWASGEVWLLEPLLSHAVGFVGCCVLLLSALAYALNFYRSPIKGAYFWVTGSYFLAHALIVASLTI